MISLSHLPLFSSFFIPIRLYSNFIRETHTHTRLQIITMGPFGKLSHKKNPGTTKSNATLLGFRGGGKKDTVLMNTLYSCIAALPFYATNH